MSLTDQWENFQMFGEICLLNLLIYCALFFFAMIQWKECQ